MPRNWSPAAFLRCEKPPRDELSYLSLLPGRGKEDRNWADDQLTERTNSLLSRVPSLPLINGELEIPARAQSPSGGPTRERAGPVAGTG